MYAEHFLPVFVFFSGLLFVYIVIVHFRSRSRPKEMDGYGLAFVCVHLCA